jgi:hypothetical protein
MFTHLLSVLHKRRIFNKNNIPDVCFLYTQILNYIPFLFAMDMTHYLCYDLDGPGSIPGRAKFSLLHSVLTDSGAHPASYPMGTRGNFPRGKAPGA